MELTPELLLEAKFGSARRGYDMAEVDDFLERCAEGLDVLLGRLRAEFDRAERAEADVADLRRGLDEGGPIAAEAFAPDFPGEQDAAPEPATAEPPTSAPTVGEPMRILIAAERTAETAIADARAEAERIRAEAESVATTQRSEAETLLARAKAEAEAEARRAGDEAKRAIQSEVVTLRRDRDALGDDVRILRRWLDDQRTRMRTTARDLQRLAEDPSALRDVPVPDLVTGGEDAAAEGPDEGGGADEAGDGPAGPEGSPAAGQDEPDLFGADEGEPTQAVPAVDAHRPFDDDDAEDAPADSVR